MAAWFGPPFGPRRRSLSPVQAWSEGGITQYPSISCSALSRRVPGAPHPAWARSTDGRDLRHAPSEPPLTTVSPDGGEFDCTQPIPHRPEAVACPQTRSLPTPSTLRSVWSPRDRAEARVICGGWSTGRSAHAGCRSVSNCACKLPSRRCGFSSRRYTCDLTRYQLTSPRQGLTEARVGRNDGGSGAA